MTSLQMDYVKFEKAYANFRYTQFRKLTKLFQVLVVIIALTFLSWSLTKFPTAVKLSGNYLVAFLLGNAIILSILFLSRQNQLHDSSGGEIQYYLDEYVRSTETIPATEIEERNFVADVIEEKRMVYVKNARMGKEKRRLERTKSEKVMKREVEVKSGRELRRSESEMSGEVVVVVSGEKMTSVEKVDSMSSEEFRLTIEAFIEKHQMSIKQQRWEDEN